MYYFYNNGVVKDKMKKDKYVFKLHRWLLLLTVILDRGTERLQNTEIE